MTQPALAFTVHEHDAPAIEVRVNFGVFAGRAATPAEIDRLAEWLLDEVDEISIIAEERHEIDAHAEASVHQIRIEVERGDTPADASARHKLESRIVERAEHWARSCVAERHADVADGL